jgi:hypothetical protein
MQVAAIFKHGFGMELNELHITKGDVIIKLSGDDWKEIEATLQGKREQASSAIKEGTYYPEEWYVWNNPKEL